jgi:hypothetical protein
MDKRSEYTEIAFEEALKQLQYSFLETKESTTIYSSEEFVLSNTVKVYDTATVNATSAISIYYHDGSDGNYFIYDTSGKLPTANKGRGYERKLEAIYNG